MLTVPVYSAAGEQIGEETIDPADFGGAINKQLLHDVVLMHPAGRQVHQHHVVQQLLVDRTAKIGRVDRLLAHLLAGGIENGNGQHDRELIKEWTAVFAALVAVVDLSSTKPCSSGGWSGSRRAGPGRLL